MSYRWSSLKAAAACLVCMALAGPGLRAAEETTPPAGTTKPQSAPPKHTMPSAEERAHKITERMKEKLNLTDEQVPKVQEINLRTAHATDAASQSAGTRDDRMAKVRAAQQERDKDLKGVLNADQWKKYEQIKGEFKQQAQAKAKGRSPKAH